MRTHLLDLGAAYAFFQRAVGISAVREYLVEQYIRPAPGARVLDFACGTGNMLPFLPEVDYLGVDTNPDYVARATKKHFGRGRFACQSVLDPLPAGAGPFDIIIGFGILHHLPDDACVALCRHAERVLAAGGRFITLDGCYRDGQHPLAYWLNRFDRGKFVRTGEAYESLARSAFPSVRRYDYCGKLRIPTDHCVLVCER
ncbi:MAG: class I SAM-dependent methyltransferase [Burkholderiales bacterium]|nr:class I SAM-dependent methyltransferase [Burkholderiales bacterium]